MHHAPPLHHYQVSSVSSKDAIERTFGAEGRHLASASAYMLVYIREGQAAEIMRHMVPSEIPVGLKERLQVSVMCHASFDVSCLSCHLFCDVLFKGGV
jgi:hypothetical protein